MKASFRLKEENTGRVLKGLGAKTNLLAVNRQS
jgi:hypothetical protein